LEHFSTTHQKNHPQTKPTDTRTRTHTHKNNWPKCSVSCHVGVEQSSALIPLLSPCPPLPLVLLLLLLLCTLPLPPTRSQVPTSIAPLLSLPPLKLLLLLCLLPSSLMLILPLSLLVLPAWLVEPRLLLFVLPSGHCME